jgi:CubicO group peptidase (beta-lactamase class C family)
MTADFVPLWCPAEGASAELVVGPDGMIGCTVVGSSAPFGWASVTKPVTAYAVLVAVEEGTVGLHDPIVGFEGVTLAHLLSHAGGIAPERPHQEFPAETKRLYSNASIRLAADHVQRHAGMAFSEYVRQGVLEPLGMRLSWGDPAAGAVGSIQDLASFAGELLRPTLVNATTLDAARRPWFSSLAGVVPGFGRFDPCPWGLGFEIRGDKQHHWTGPRNHPETYGHFGQSGSLLAVDPSTQRAACSLSPVPFGPWALHAWPGFCEHSLGRA